MYNYLEEFAVEKGLINVLQHIQTLNTPLQVTVSRRQGFIRGISVIYDYLKIITFTILYVIED